MGPDGYPATQTGVSSPKIGEVVVASEELSGVVPTPSNPVETQPKPMFGPERPPTFNSIVASGSMAPSEITLRKRLATILCSDKSEAAKFSKVDDLVQLINHGADAISVSETNEVVRDVMSEYAKTQLTPCFAPGNIVLQAIERTTSFAKTS